MSPSFKYPPFEETRPMKKNWFSLDKKKEKISPPHKKNAVDFRRLILNFIINLSHPFNCNWDENKFHTSNERGAHYAATDISDIPTITSPQTKKRRMRVKISLQRANSGLSVYTHVYLHFNSQVYSTFTGWGVCLIHLNFFLRLMKQIGIEVDKRNRIADLQNKAPL